MPREQRIQYPGAISHAMARGNRREDIVHDDLDRQRFEGTLEEVVEAGGWHLYAWVLMGKHYHLLFKTPEPNMVEGMSWFQNTWTHRFNTRHKLWGHLFGDRYKDKPVEEGEYLTCLLSYIHLNPARASLVSRRGGVESYPWSSLADYLKPPRKRRSWVAVSRGLQHLELPDTAAGRRPPAAAASWRGPKAASTGGIPPSRATVCPTVRVCIRPCGGAGTLVAKSFARSWWLCWAGAMMSRRRNRRAITASKPVTMAWLKPSGS